MKKQAIVWFLVNPLSFHTPVSLPGSSTQLMGCWRSTAPKWIRRQFISLQQMNAAPFQTLYSKDTFSDVDASHKGENIFGNQAWLN
jgi:hypothetical protein